MGFDPGLHLFVDVARVAPLGFDGRADDDADGAALLEHSAARPEITGVVRHRHDLAMADRRGGAALAQQDGRGADVAKAAPGDGVGRPVQGNLRRPRARRLQGRNGLAGARLSLVQQRLTVARSRAAKAGQLANARSQVGDLQNQLNKLQAQQAAREAG